MSVPFSAKLREVRAVGIVLLALTQCGCLTIAHGLIGRDGPDTERRVRLRIPDGTDLAVAERLMKKNGYRCQTLPDERYFDPVSNRNLHGLVLSCGARAGVSGRGGFLFQDEYGVDFLIEHGTVRFLDASAYANAS